MSVEPAVTLARAIEEVGREAWERCAAAPEYGANPFVSYDFLSALEDSGCVGGRTGWTPAHLRVEDAAGVASVMPLYLKAHSQGEYVFDHSWARAYEQAGGRYYPKLQCAAPFSPVTGPRLMTRADADRDGAFDTLLKGAVALCGELGASSLHVTFAAALSANRRKTIRRERRDAQAGLESAALTGSDLREEHWDAFFAFYMDTGARKWGRPYLNRRFFSLRSEKKRRLR